MRRAPWLACGLALLLSSCQAPDLEIDPSASAHELTTELRSFLERTDDNNELDALERQWLLDLAELRYRALRDLAEEDPDELLEATLGAPELDALPSFVEPYLERHVDLEGQVIVRVDEIDEGDSRVVHRLRTANKTFGLSFPRRLARPTLSTFEPQPVSGVLIEDQITVDEAVTWAARYENALEPPAGVGNTMVLLVNFIDNPSEPYTPAQANDAIFGADSLRTRLESLSRGRFSIAGSVQGWWTLDRSKDNCDPDYVLDDARAKAIENGVDLNGVQYFIVGFPNPTTGCPTASGNIGGSPGGAFMGASTMLNTTATFHELGHNLGFWHSHKKQGCTLGAGPPSGCSNVDYGHQIDAMGQGAGYFAPYQVERLGWLGSTSSDPIISVTTSGQYVIEPLAASTTGAKALRIAQSYNASSGVHKWYTVEFRQPVGLDAYYNQPSFGGVLVSINERGKYPSQLANSSGNKNYMIDMTPGTTGANYDEDLAVGQTFSDPTNGVDITTVSVSPTQATLDVTITPPAGPCTRNPPSVSASSNHTKLQAGETAVYSVTVTNNDVDCPPTELVLTATGLEAGWSFESVPTSLPLVAGGQTDMALRITSDAGASAGNRSFDIVVTDPSDASHSASVSTTYNLTNCVFAPPTMQMVESRLQGARGDELTYSVQIHSPSTGNCETLSFSTTGYTPTGWSTSSVNGSVAPGATVTMDWNVTSDLASTAGDYTVGLGLVVNGDRRHQSLVWATTIYEVLDCTRVDPTITLTPASQTAIPGELATFQVNVTNNNDAICPLIGFSLLKQRPDTSWTMLFDIGFLTPNNGATATTNVQVAAPSGTAAGTYQLGVEANDFAGQSDTAYIDLVVTDPPDAGFIPDSGVVDSGSSPDSGVITDSGAPPPDGGRQPPPPPPDGGPPPPPPDGGLPPPPDGGTPPPPLDDAGTPPPPDAGVPPPADSGLPPPLDGGTAVSDAGTQTAPDAGTPPGAETNPVPRDPIVSPPSDPSSEGCGCSSLSMQRSETGFGLSFTLLVLPILLRRRRRSAAT